MSKKDRNIAIGAAIGAGVGFLTGILTAKKPGRETRQDIVNATVNFKRDAEKKIKQLNLDLSEIIDKAEEQFSGAKSTAQASLSKAIETAKSTKDHVRQVLSSIHEGDVEDEDLKKAIDDANKAIEHLKDYLKNLPK